jgi:hypothetical protein
MWIRTLEDILANLYYARYIRVSPVLGTLPGEEPPDDPAKQETVGYRVEVDMNDGVTLVLSEYRTMSEADSFSRSIVGGFRKAALFVDTAPAERLTTSQQAESLGAELKPSAPIVEAETEQAEPAPKAV